MTIDELRTLRGLSMTKLCDAAGLSMGAIFRLTRPGADITGARLETLMKLAAGLDVALLTLGDVSVYSSFCYVMDLVRAAGYETVMIPGVPSFCASAAALGRSLTEMNEPLHILPAGGRLSLPEALALPGTKVLMKAGRQLPQVVAELEQRGLADTSALVMNCGLPDQQLCPTLHEYQGQTGYFATLLVGRPEPGAD